MLLVEDSPTDQDQFRTVLTGAGHRVCIAPNGQAALHALRRERFDLVRFADVPIVALTANALAQDESSYREVGMNDYAAKPVDLDRLLDKVDEWIDSKRAGC